MKFIVYKAYYTLCILIIALTCIGCDDSGIVNKPPVIDDTYMYYRDRVISGRSLPSEFNSVDLLRGLIVQEISSTKDAILIDSAQLNQKFYFSSGDILNAVGFKTGFIQYVYKNITQSCFDSITVIPDADSLVKEDFKDVSSGCFSDSIETHPVFGFFLSGKYNSGVTSMPVYGLIYVDSTWREENVLKLRFDIKLNKTGKNRFRK